MRLHRQISQNITTNVLILLSLLEMISSYYGILIIPILLLHGYAENSSVWNLWANWLKADQFANVKTVAFHNDDQCGSVQEHALELQAQVNNLLQVTHSDKVNIVAHSKGGLDARWYITHNRNKVANLIMIAVPNKGTTASYINLTPCSFSNPNGLLDLQPGSD